MKMKKKKKKAPGVPPWQGGQKKKRKVERVPTKAPNHESKRSDKKKLFSQSATRKRTSRLL